MLTLCNDVGSNVPFQWFQEPALDFRDSSVRSQPFMAHHVSHLISCRDPNQSSGGGNTGGGDSGDTGDANYQPRPDAYHIPEGTYVIRNLKARTVVDLERSTGGENVRVFGYQENGGANQKVRALTQPASIKAEGRRYSGKSNQAARPPPCPSFA
jgi:hypothetical protein